MLEEGLIVSRKNEDAADTEQKFQMYYDYREPAKSIPSHRMLAIRRGESETILYFAMRLEQSLGNIIESCVNRVGVDLNTASWALLRYIAGVNERTAKKIIEFRNDHGRFRSRAQLTAVAGVGPKTFEQAAGFLRIREGDNPLDMTAVHPESYPIVQQIAALLGVSLKRLIQEPDLLKKVDKTALTAGAYTVTDILEELQKPGRDPRDQFVAPSFQEGVAGDLRSPTRDEARRCSH
jgi:competence ComEA-like helix-hairpin-helix protein